MFASSPLPTEKDEVWRYSRIDELDLDRYRPTLPADHATDDRRAWDVRVAALLDSLGPRSALLVTAGGELVGATTEPAPGLMAGRLTDVAGAEEPADVAATTATDYRLLNEAFAADPLVVDVAAGTELEAPVVVVHLVGGRDGTATFPRTLVRARSGARVGVVEMVVDAGTDLLGTATDPATGAVADGPGRDRLVVPVTELEVADDATLRYVGIQSLHPDTWHIGHQASTVGRDATLCSFALALGGGYARLRTDSTLQGESGRSELRAAFVGRDDQMLDFRTKQDHVAPRTVSDLLFMGAVADRSHSVYSGLIRIRRGAVRSDARQTNHNLVLDEGAHADSVPNLDIEENDVRCSHGSTVGPVDEDQRYYLESRGVEPDRAEQLIVAGFFRAISEQVPVAGVGPLVARALARRAGVVRG